jgi:FlaG/FlaF family flagellin (archaellin)
VPSRTNIESANVKPALTALNDGYLNYVVPSASPQWQAIADKMSLGDMPTEYHPLDGFSFDTTNLSVEMAQLEQVRLQYLQPLRCGVTNDIDADMANVIKQYGDSLTRYLTELQNQITAFKEAKGL